MDDAPLERKEDDDFDALYRGHVGDVYRYSLSLVRNPVDAEDVTQTTFLNAFEAFSDHPPRKPRPWLIAIARNICHERYRQSLRRPQQVTLHEAAATPDDDYSVRAEEILSALQGIPSRQRMALLLDGLEGRSRAEIAEKLGIGEATVSGLLTRGRNNLRLQLDEGMTCERAKWARPRLWANGIPRAERRAALAHLRNCEQCGAVAKPARSLAGLLGTLWLGVRKLTEPGARLAPGTGGLGEVVAGAGGAFAVKAVLLATVGTLAGGVAWHEASRSHVGQPPGSRSEVAVAHPVETAAALPPVNRPGPPAESAAVTDGETPAPSRPGGPAAGSTSVAHQSPAAGDPALPAPPGAAPDLQLPATGAEEQPLPVTSGSDTDPAPSGTPSTGSDLTTPAANDGGGQGQGNAGQAQGNGGQGSGGLANDVLGNPGGGQATAPGQLKQINGTTGGQTNAPGQQRKTDSPSGQAGAPGQQKKTASSTGGQTNAPGQEKKTAGEAAANQAAAPGQQTAPGQAGTGDAQGNSGGGQATAPGQQNNPAPGNSGGGQTTAPGQQDNPGQGNSGAGQATAPGQQNNPGQGNSGAGQTTAPGQQNNPVQGNSGAGQTTAPGQQNNSGQGNSSGNGNAGS